MRICQPHWGELKQAITDKGLAHLISKSSDDVVNRMKKELSNELHVRDPLLSANFAIWNNAIEQGGIYLLSTNENGDPYCPLCELNKHGGDHKKWIEYAANEQLENCKKENLINHQ